MTNEMLTCSSCEGRGQARALVYYGSSKGCVWEMVDCPICRGRGEVSRAEQEAMAAGRALRDARVAAGISMHQAASERGISIREYSDLEWGRTSTGDSR